MVERAGETEEESAPWYDFLPSEEELPAFLALGALAFLGAEVADDGLMDCAFTLYSSFSSADSFCHMAPMTLATSVIFMSLFSASTFGRDSCEKAMNADRPRFAPPSFSFLAAFSFFSLGAAAAFFSFFVDVSFSCSSMNREDGFFTSRFARPVAAAAASLMTVSVTVCV